MDNHWRNRLPYVTIILVAVNILYFLYLEIAGSSTNNLFMIQHGAMFAPLVVEGRQYYRLLTSIFMHFGYEHLSNNMLILCVLGYRLERTFGRLKYLMFYLICGIGSNVVSMMFDLNAHTQVVSAGASGAIFGVAGGLLYAVLINRGRLDDLNFRQMLILVALSLYLGYTSAGVDNVAHVAGVVIGVAVAALIYHRPKPGGLENGEREEV